MSGIETARSPISVQMQNTSSKDIIKNSVNFQAHITIFFLKPYFGNPHHLTFGGLFRPQ